jgi:hypothetical protein
MWEGVKTGRCEVWVVRRVARMSRTLDRHQARIVDTAVAAALDQAPSRILAIAEAKVIEADPLAHQARINKNQQQKGVWYPQPRPGSQIDNPDNPGNTAGIGTVFARLDEADALAHQQTVHDLAAALAEHATPPIDDQEPLSMDHWRAEAFAMLADPAAVLTRDGRVGRAATVSRPPTLLPELGPSDPAASPTGLVTGVRSTATNTPPT